MGEQTEIAWTDHTFNPWIGCQRVSPACANCLSPETLVLMADMSWRAIGDVKVGDVLYGFDEGTQNRLMRRSTVQAVWATRRPTITITTESGRTITASTDHRFLVNSRRGGKWLRADQLVIGSSLRSTISPAGAADTSSREYRAGYISGVTAGDGTMRFDPSWRSDKLGFPQMYWRVAVVTDDCAILDRLVDYLADFGVDAEVKPFRGGQRPMSKVECRAAAHLGIIASLMVPMASSRLWKAGWLAGFLDTDGTASGSMRANGVIHRWTQVHARNDHLDRTVEYLDALGFNSALEIRERGASSVRLVARTIAERMDLVAALAPALERKGVARLYGNADGERASRHPREADCVVSLALGPPADLVDITTSTGTFVAEGVSTHNCYAEALDHRWGGGHWGKNAPRRVTSDSNWRKPLAWNRKAEADGVRRRVFCASMADVFEDREDLDDARALLWELIAETPALDWLLLTKRPENILDFVPDEWWQCGWCGGSDDPDEDQRPCDVGPHGPVWPANVWVGTTVEDQQRADERIPWLARVPAPVRFLSCEPLLDEVDLINHVESVGWVICGGESGPGHRPLDLDHARSLRQQCRLWDVPFFFKQVGGATPKAGGDLLDGVEHKAFPLTRITRGDHR